MSAVAHILLPSRQLGLQDYDCRNYRAINDLVQRDLSCVIVDSSTTPFLTISSWHDVSLAVNHTRRRSRLAAALPSADCSNAHRFGTYLSVTSHFAVTRRRSAGIHEDALIRPAATDQQKKVLFLSFKYNTNILHISAVCAVFILQLCLELALLACFPGGIMMTGLDHLNTNETLPRRIIKCPTISAAHRH